MRILIVHESYAQRGGEDAAVEADVGLLRDHGHDVTCWFVRNEDIAAWPIHRRARLALETTWSISSRRRLRGLVDEHRPEVVHFHNTLPIISPAAIRAARHAGTAVVMTLHNYRLVCPAGTLLRKGAVCEECIDHSLVRSIVHACYRGSRVQSAAVAAMLSVHRRIRTWSDCVDACIALTPFMRSRMEAAGIPPDRIHIRHNATPADTPRPSPGAGGGYAAFVGRLSAEKGVGVLLDALPELRGLPIRIAGGGPLEGRVRRAAAVHPGLSYAGEVAPAEARALIAGAGVLLLPSVWYEGFPMTVLEAFAAGVPVVASRIGGIPDVVTDDRDGLLVPPASPAALAQGTIRILRDPALRARMGDAASRTYRERFSSRSSYEILMGIYRDAIAASRSGEAVAIRHRELANR